MTGNDARFGSRVFDGAKYIEGIVRMEMIPDSLEFKYINPVFRIDRLRMSPGDLVLSGISVPNDKIGHAIVILGINYLSQEILVFDPYYPNHLQSLRYREIMEPFRLQVLAHNKWIDFDHGVLIRKGILKALPQDIQQKLSK
jgi:hypothetical protein